MKIRMVPLTLIQLNSMILLGEMAVSVGRGGDWFPIDVDGTTDEKIGRRSGAGRAFSPGGGSRRETQTWWEIRRGVQ